jgi:uncharacterized protein (DUF849 family)
MSFLSTLEADVAKAFAAAKADLIVFLAKVKTGEQILAADIHSVLKAIEAHAQEINSTMAAVSANLPTVLSWAQAAGVPQKEIDLVKQAAVAASDVVVGLNSVSTSLSGGSGDVSAIVSGVAAVAKASGSTNAVVHALAQLPVPVQAQVVSPPSPSPQA